jgi:glycosyltransferase involved in cell wall biosynthesis
MVKLMMPHRPRVSIGLPVYNGERLLPQALDAILTQTFQDFELIISDNASTDRTREICETYAAKDPRIKYFRNDHNIGISRNFNRTFELSSGEYFKWCAHDDLIAPELLQQCVDVLDRHSTIVLCYPKAIDIDDEGTELRYFIYKLRTDSPKASERFHDLLRYGDPCLQLFGVVRANVLRKTPLHEHYSAADRVLIARLGLLGRFHHLDGYLHYNRQYPGTTTKTYRTRHALTVLHDPSKAGKIVLPYWMIFFGYLRAIVDAPLSLIDRVQCYLYMMGYLRKWRKKMTEDLILAAKHLLRPLYYKLRVQRSQ